MIRIDGNSILDWPSFHSVFRTAFGFPDFYGCNMNAWIDCLSYIDDPSAGMTSVHTSPGVAFTLIIENAAELKRRCPEQFEALVECAAFVNWRTIEQGGSSLLALAFDA